MLYIPRYSAKKHYELYSQTLSCYKALFDTQPDGLVWESASIRFEKGPKMIVNLFRLVSVIVKRTDYPEALIGRRKRK